jgi:hypothetical protein
MMEEQHAREQEEQRRRQEREKRKQEEDILCAQYSYCSYSITSNSGEHQSHTNAAA